MQRGRSQQPRRAESKAKNAVQKPKVIENKTKTFGQTVNLSKENSSKYAIESPYLNKKLQSDKQNNDMFQAVLKIVAAAAQPKQRDILLGLLALQQKQKKIKGFAANKQSAHERQELQTMLTHLRQQQQRLLCSLKIEIGKRKLHSLDEHDLKEDILNLNSYVMRRTKKESIILKEQGIDLFGEIYNKFDEQTRIINQVLKDKSNAINTHQINASRSKATKLGQQIESTSSERVKTQLSNSCSKSELMQKIIELERENLRLMKQINKIEQEFECVVEEKLILQQKYQRLQNSSKSPQYDIKESLNTLRNEVCQQRQSFLEYRSQICTLLKNYFTELAFFKETQQRILQNGRANNQYDEQDNKNNKVVESKVSNIVHLRTVDQENRLMDEYESMLTQKQLQINNLLKTLSKLNAQKRVVEQQNQQLIFRMNIKQQNMIGFKRRAKQLPSLFANLKAIRTQNKLQIKELVQKYETQCLNNIGKMRDQISKFVNLTQLQVITSNSSHIDKLTKQMSKLAAICQSQKQQNLQLKNEIIYQKAKIEQLITEHQQQKEQLVYKLTQTQRRFQVQKTKFEQTENTQIKQIQELQQQIKKITTEKQLMVKNISDERDHNILHLTAQFQKVQFLLSQANQQNNKHSRLLNEQVNKNSELNDRINQLQKQYNTKLNQVNSANKTVVSQLKQLLKARNEAITQANIQIQIKQDKLTLANIQLERQRMKVQDILSQAVEKCSTQDITKRKSIFATLNQIKLQQIKIGQQQIKNSLKQFNLWLGSSIAQFFQKLQLKCCDIYRQLSQTKKAELKIEYHVVELQITKQEQKSYQKIKQLSDLNSIQAHTPNQVNCMHQSHNSHSFMADEPNILSEFTTEQFNQMLNVSGFVEEVQALKSQLLDSFKQNQLLSEELKLYQQKQIDKIFDF